MKIALIVAMDKEFAQLRSLLENEKAETHRNITLLREPLVRTNLFCCNVASEK